MTFNPQKEGNNHACEMCVFVVREAWFLLRPTILTVSIQLVGSDF